MVAKAVVACRICGAAKVTGVCKTCMVAKVVVACRICGVAKVAKIIMVGRMVQKKSSLEMLKMEINNISGDFWKVEK
jgi:recombinational DNA repair protein RecR